MPRAGVRESGVEKSGFAHGFGGCELQGYFKVLGKGVLPSVPIVVKAKYFSKEVRFVTVALHSFMVYKC